MKPLRLCPALRLCALAAPCLIGLRANAAPTGQAFSDFFSYPTGYGLSLTITVTPRAANLPPQGNPPLPLPPLLAQLPAETEFFISEDLPSEVPEPASALLLAPALALWRAREPPDGPQAESPRGSRTEAARERDTPRLDLAEELRTPVT
jgi:hypothetical protein